MGSGNKHRGGGGGGGGGERVAAMGNRNGARAALAQWLHARHSGYSKSWRKQLGLVGGVGRTVHRCVGEAPRLLEFPEKEVREPDFERNTKRCMYIDRLKIRLYIISGKNRTPPR